MSKFAHHAAILRLRKHVYNLEGRFSGDPPPYGKLATALKRAEDLAAKHGASDHVWMAFDEARADLRKNERAAQSALLRGLTRLAKEERDEVNGVPHHLRSSPKRKRASYGRKTSHCDGCGKQRTDVRGVGPEGEIGLCWVCRKEGEKGRFYSHRAGRYVHQGEGDASRSRSRSRRRR